MRRVTVIVLLAAMIAGCSAGVLRVTRTIRTTDHAGRVTTTTDTSTGYVRTPYRAVDGGTLTMGDISANTGAAQAIDQALAQLGGMWLVGVLIAAGGVLTLVARHWFPFVPAGASWGLIALGVGIIALPMLLDRLLNPMVIMLIAAGGALGVAYAVGAFDNFTHRKDIT